MMTFTLGIPQLIMCGFMVMALGSNAIMHGKKREGKYNFWAASIAIAIEAGVLAWGGFFG